MGSRLWQVVACALCAGGRAATAGDLETEVLQLRAKVRELEAATAATAGDLEVPQLRTKVRELEAEIKQLRGGGLRGRSLLFGYSTTDTADSTCYGGYTYGSNGFLPTVAASCTGTLDGDVEIDFSDIDDASLEQLAGVTEITGGLTIIMDEDSENDLSALASLKKLGGDLWIKGSGDCDIAALASLKEVGGVVWMTYNPSLQTLSLPKLEEIKGGYDPIEGGGPYGLYLSHNSGLVTIDFPALEVCDDIRIFNWDTGEAYESLKTISLPSLKTADLIDIQEGCSKYVDEYLGISEPCPTSITSIVLSSLTQSELRILGDLPSSYSVPEWLTSATLDISSMQVAVGLEITHGAFDTILAESLVAIDGDFVYEPEHSNLADFSCFENVVVVAGDLTMGQWQGDVLDGTSFEGWTNLTHVVGRLRACTENQGDVFPSLVEADYCDFCDGMTYTLPSGYTCPEPPEDDGDDDYYSSGGDDDQYYYDGCEDTSGDATDVDGYLCSAYEDGDEACGGYDDEDFDSVAMCCACGGGNRE